MTKQQALFKYALRLGDNALILSHRLSEWCSNAPFIEEDLALTNFALDMIGRARVFLEYAGEIEGRNRDEDMLAFRRPEHQYYNNLITELPNGDFAFTMVRQLFISAFEKGLFSALQNSTDAAIAAIAAKTLKEVWYHLVHSEDWMERLGNGTAESHERLQNAVNALWMFTGELFETDEVERQLVADGTSTDASALKEDWFSYISNVLRKANMVLPENNYMQTGGRNGVHTEHLGHLLSEMQYLQRTYPEAVW